MDSLSSAEKILKSNFLYSELFDNPSDLVDVAKMVLKAWTFAFKLTGSESSVREIFEKYPATTHSDSSLKDTLYNDDHYCKDDEPIDISDYVEKVFDKAFDGSETRQEKTFSLWKASMEDYFKDRGIKANWLVYEDNDLKYAQANHLFQDSMRGTQLPMIDSTILFELFKSQPQKAVCLLNQLINNEPSMMVSENEKKSRFVIDNLLAFIFLLTRNFCHKMNNISKRTQFVHQRTKNVTMKIASKKKRFIACFVNEFIRNLQHHYPSATMKKKEILKIKACC